jgi:aminodeoxyfutalosine synthase
VAQASLWFGVDDLDGTVQEEKIYHMAGARTPEAMTTGEIRRLIRAAGRDPIERDTLYNVIVPAAEVEPLDSARGRGVASSGVVQ